MTATVAPLNFVYPKLKRYSFEVRGYEQPTMHVHTYSIYKHAHINACRHPLIQPTPTHPPTHTTHSPTHPPTPTHSPPPPHTHLPTHSPDCLDTVLHRKWLQPMTFKKQLTLLSHVYMYTCISTLTHLCYQLPVYNTSYLMRSLRSSILHH